MVKVSVALGSPDSCGLKVTVKDALWSLPTSNAQPTTTTETLTGTGTAAPTYTVNLSWNASTSPDISGYNIDRAV